MEQRRHLRTVDSVTKLKRLTLEAAKRGVVLPASTTTARYGWTLVDWLSMLESQGWVCPICGRAPRTGKYVTDHEHVRGWKNMPDEERALYIRGLTCWVDNRYLLARGISVQVALNVADYLQRFEDRRPQ